MVFSLTSIKIKAEKTPSVHMAIIVKSKERGDSILKSLEWSIKDKIWKFKVVWEEIFNTLIEIYRISTDHSISNQKSTAYRQDKAKIIINIISEHPIIKFYRKLVWTVLLWAIWTWLDNLFSKVRVVIQKVQIGKWVSRLNTTNPVCFQNTWTHQSYPQLQITINWCSNKEWRMAVVLFWHQALKLTILDSLQAFMEVWIDVKSSK